MHEKVKERLYQLCQEVCYCGIAFVSILTFSMLLTFFIGLMLYPFMGAMNGVYVGEFISVIWAMCALCIIIFRTKFEGK